jgi:cytochrome c oxidase cbb3-type subunit I/II
MLFSLMLWMPSLGRHDQRLLTLRGAWHKVAADPVLKFFVVGVTFYGMSTFEGPCSRVKSVNSLSTTPTGPSPTCTRARWAGTAS